VKNGVLENKSGNISETLKDVGKVTMGPIGTHQRSFERYHPRPPILEIGGLQLSYPLLSQEKVNTDFKFGGYIYRANPNKSPLKFLEKRERGPIQGLPNFLGTPCYLRNG